MHRSASPPIAWPPVRATRCCLRSTQRSSAPTRPSACRTSTRSSTKGSSRSSSTCTLPASLKSNPQRGSQQLRNIGPVAQAVGVRVEGRSRRQRDPHPGTARPLRRRGAFAAFGVHRVQHRALLRFGLSLEAGGRQAILARLHGRHLRRPGHPTVAGEACARASQQMNDNPYRHYCGYAYYGRPPTTRPCAHRRETTPRARKRQASAGGSSRPRRATRPTCLTSRRRLALVL